MGSVIGETLMKMAGLPYYSPTFGRGGLAAVFACEGLQFSGGGTLDIDVEHKNHDDTGFTLLGSFTQITTALVETLDASAIKEQIRFKYTIGGTNVYSAVHFNMLAPSWRPY
jgi:hypothetical protein